MRIMSIIGIVWFSFCLICIVVFMETDLVAAGGWGVLGLLYAIPFSIVGLVDSNKKQQHKKTQNNYMDELIKLNELREKGILSEVEFEGKKRELL